MKFKLIIVICLLAAICCSADTIVMKDGTTRTVYNVEEAGNWILYTETASLDSELRRIAAKDVFAIKKDDGQMQAVGGDAVQSQNGKQSVQTDMPTPGAPRFVAPQPHPQNDSIIAEYNCAKFINRKKANNKFFGGFAHALLGIGKESILCDDNIIVDFEYKYEDEYEWFRDAFNWYHYSISLYNKSDKIVYVDLTSSFRIIADEAQPIYDSTIYSENAGRSQGGSFGLGALTNALGIGGVLGTLAGGVNVGGSSNSGVSVSQSMSPILIIPPKSKAYLPLRRDVVDNKVSEIYEKYFSVNTNPNITGESLLLYKNSAVYFCEEKSLKEFGYRISYSTSPNFEEYTTLPIKLYFRGLYGGHCNVDAYRPHVIYGSFKIRKK